MESGVFESEGDDYSNDDFCFFSSAKVGEWEAHLESKLTPGEESCCVTRETSPKTAHNPHNPPTHTTHTAHHPTQACGREVITSLVSHPTSTSLPTRHRLVIPPLSSPSVTHHHTLCAPVARARLVSQNFFCASGPCCTSCSPRAEARRRRTSPHHRLLLLVTHSDVQFDHAVHHNNPSLLVSLLVHFTPALSLSRSTFPANMSDDPSWIHVLGLSNYDVVDLGLLGVLDDSFAAEAAVDKTVAEPALVGESAPPYPTTHASAQPPLTSAERPAP
jgi:hypothetical protein